MPDGTAPLAAPSFRARLRLVLAPRLHVGRRAIGFVVPLLTLLLVSWEWNGIPGQPLRDTRAYYDAGRAAAGGGSIYDPLPSPGPHEFREREYLYLYPPPLAAFLSLVPPVGYRAFDRGWLILNLLAFWVFAAALARIARGRWSAEGTLEWGAAAFFLPGAWIGIHFGNIEMVVLALVALGFAIPTLAGFTLALGAAIKLTPAWPLCSRATRDPRSTLRGAALAAALCAGLCLFVFGARESVALSRQWITQVMPTLAQGQFWGESLSGLRGGSLRLIDYLNNLSLSFLPVQIAVLNGWSYRGGDLPGLVRVWLTGVAVGGPLIAAWLSRRRSSTLQGAIVFAAALLSGPIVRPYHVAPALLLVIAAVRRERRGSSGVVERDVAASEQDRDGILMQDPPVG